MNSKKSKKKAKPQSTSIPVDKIEEIKETQEKVEKVDSGEKQCEIEKVPEVISEVKSDDAAPKKPKRYRKNKKKQEKEEDLLEVSKSIEVEQQISDVSTSQEAGISCSDNNAKETNIVEETNRTSQKNDTITAALVLNENKDSEITPSSEYLKQELVTNKEDNDKVVKVCEIEKTKKCNKKNKKKKRYDSENSDKVEEITCTSTFQQLVESGEAMSTNDLMQEKVQCDSAPIEILEAVDSSNPESQSIIDKQIEQINKNDTAQQALPVTNEQKLEIKESMLKDENKNKKRNKKDKKASKETYSGDTEDMEELPKSAGVNTQDTRTLTGDVKSTILDESKSCVDISTEQESSDKTKAKAVIAKPIEKKKKGKKDDQEADSAKGHVPSEEIQDEAYLIRDNLTTERNDQPGATTIPTEKLEDQEPASAFTPEFEVIRVPDNAMGKKRKKSPKIPNVIIPLPIVALDITSENNIESKEAPEKTVTLTADHEKTKETSPENMLQTPLNIDTPHISNRGPEAKSRKKGKKSQKLPVTPGVTDFTPTFHIDLKSEVDEKNEFNSDKPHQPTVAVCKLTTSDIGEPCLGESKSTCTDKAEEKCNIPDIPFIDTDTNIDTANLCDTSENITETEENKSTEVSPKTKVETPTLDIVPDIHYPRSTSQGFDGNNNTVITEVRPDELQIPTLKDNPVVQGSGETPIGTPKMIASDIVISEVAETEQIKEKTDIKSKMLEVNRDMEELRMSIERSLAGFTAIEASEENIEKEYENKMTSNLQEIEKKLIQESQCNIGAQSIGIEQNIKHSLELVTEKVIETKQTALTANVSKESLTIEVDLETLQAEQKLIENKDIEQQITKKEIEVTGEIPIECATVSDNSEKENIMIISEKQESKCIEPSIPSCPPRKDNKGKNKKKRGRQEAPQSNAPSQSTQSAIVSKDTEENEKKHEKSDKTEKSAGNSEEKGKQQSSTEHTETTENLPKTNAELTDSADQINIDFEAIENFEDALTSSTEDVDINKSFDMIVSETNAETVLNQQKLAANKPEIKIIGPDETPKEKITPPKNLLGHPDIPASSSKTDYKKEKNKTPNTSQAKVKIKDSVDVELPQKDKCSKEKTESLDTSEVKENTIKENGDYKEIVEQKKDDQTNENKSIEPINKSNTKTVNAAKKKQSKLSQTENKKNSKSAKTKDSFTQLNGNDEFVYKYSFRKVFLQNTCNVCKKELKLRVPCNYCNLLFYCSNKHKDEDWPQHQALCFAISTIGHLKDQKYIYADTKNVTGQNYRLIRMQMILSCEKVLKRRLVPWEQELLLYPRICADVSCRQWKQSKLKDCDGCGQISYCVDKPEHLPKTHQRWCKSYSLYQKLVIHQQTKGRLETKMPTRVMAEPYQIPDKINEVFASMYEEKIDMNDVQYAALTQLATAPLTAAYGHQVYTKKVNSANGISKKSLFTIHVVGAELQFEADALNKWEVFFLHLLPHVQELKVVLVSTDLNPSNLPLDLLANIKHCENCMTNKRRVSFSFQDNKKYAEYRSSVNFCYPDLICAFNPSIQRSSIYKELDAWPSTLNSVLRTKVPFIITSYTITELLRDSMRIKECVDVDYKVISEPKYNSFASVRPDRNFITDDEMPLLFKNYCFMIICGC